MVRNQRKMPTQSEYLTNEKSMETTNIELARAVAEFKTLYNEALNEKNYFQKEWFTSTLRIKKLESYVNHIDCAAQDIIRSAVTLSNHATDILHCVNSVKRIVNSDNSMHLHSPNLRNEEGTTENKMQVVKPMISGHVILRPTINLRRVNELSLEQAGNSSPRRSAGEHAGQSDFANNDSFQRLSSNVILNRRRTHREYEEGIEDNEDDNEELEESMDSNDGHQQVNNRLDTIEEEDVTLGHNNSSLPRRSSMSSNRSAGASLAIPSTSAQVPLLSGVFKDVRVYLSPVDPHTNITKVRGSSKSHFKRSSEIQSPRLSVNLSNSSLTENLNAREVEESESALSMDNSLITFRPCTSTPLQNSNLFNESSNFNTDNTNKNRSVNKKNNSWLKNNRRNTEFLYRPNGVEKFLRKTRSTNGNALLNDDYDPLEGPSNLLDNSYDKNKLNTLAGLGLTPTTTVQPPLNSASPAVTVLKRRSLKRESDDSTPVRRSKLYVTKRKLEKRHLKSPKVILPRLSPSKIKIESRRGRKRTKKVKSEIESPKLNTSTPSKLQVKGSPKKRQRKNISLKEPSLLKKLRRSK